MATPEEIVARIRDVGVERWNRFVDGDRLRALRTACTELLASDEVETQSRSLRVWNLFTFGPVFRNLLLDPRLRATCTALLGDGYVVSDYSLNAVYPGAAQDPWHVDFPYSEMPQRVESCAPLGLQCVLALDPFDSPNGATQFVPDSWGRTLPDVVRPSQERIERFDAQPGDLLVMHAGTWHRAGLNTSCAIRSGVVLSFVQRWIRPIVASRDVASVWSDAMPDELSVLLGAVVFETIDSQVVRREVV